MKPTRACRHCGSPARGNPCWYFINHPKYSGSDPPCAEDDYYENERPHPWITITVIVSLAAAAAAAVFALI